MQPAALFCAFTASWVIYVQSKEICGKNHYTVTYSNGSFYECLKCDTCHSGYGLYPPCGEPVTYPANSIDCKLCPNGTFSNALDSAPCHICQDCVEHEIIAAPCTKESDRKCNKTCERGYFFAKKTHDCQQCSYCCFDGKDEEQPECMKQGLNATGRHCSGRFDKRCDPPSTTAVTTTVTHTPPVTHPSSHHQNTAVTDLPPTTHPSNQHQSTTSSGLDNVITPTHPSSKHHTAAIIGLGILGGLLSVALVVGAILHQRKSRVWRRKRIESNPTSVQIHFEADGRGPRQGSNDNNASQSLESALYPRIQALQNTAYTATPEVSPSATPQQTDDEVEELPDVIAVRKKRLLKRQSSKDAQRNHAPNNDGANVNLLDSKVDVQAPNDGNFKGQDSKVGGQTKPRKASLEAVFKRKLSFSQEKDDNQLLGEEDLDEPQGNGETRSKSRSGSIISFKELKRKFSLPEKEHDYQPVRGEDSDEDQSDCKNFSTTCNEPVKIKVEPVHQRKKEGSRVEFKCIVPGKSEVSYQWIKDGNTEIQRQNDSTLALSSVELRDFGHYACQVSFVDSQCGCKKSSAAVLDVDPRDGMGYRYLSDVDLDSITKVETLLTKTIQGLGGWRQVAYKYKMDKDVIDSLERDQDVGKTIISYLKANNPDLTVYEFCKTLKERNIRRFDIIKELLSQISVPAPEGTT